MIQLVVACHGRFAEELVNSAAMVFGEAEGVHAVTFMPGEGPEDLIRKYEAIIAETGSADDVLFLVDLFGGSPYNAAIRVVAPTAKADVLSGVNLPMLLELLDSRDEKSTVADLVASAYNASFEGTKAFRNALPTASATPAPAEAAAPVADHRAGRRNRQRESLEYCGFFSVCDTGAPSMSAPWTPPTRRAHATSPSKAEPARAVDP